MIIISILLTNKLLQFALFILVSTIIRFVCFADESRSICISFIFSSNKLAIEISRLFDIVVLLVCFQIIH